MDCLCSCMLIVDSRTKASQGSQYHILSIMHGKLVGGEVPEGLEVIDRKFW
jgi:hypothetical protein